MVMYRDFTKRNAYKLGLVGAVRNMGDGSVHIEAEGDGEKLAEFVRVLHKGPFFSRVKSVTVSHAEPATGNYSDFRIVY